MRCKKCGTKIHYCSNCSYDFDNSAGFCSEECREKSDEYKNIRRAARSIGKKLSIKDREELQMVIEAIEWIVYEHEVFDWLWGEK
jgi:hypothetical protein